MKERKPTLMKSLRRIAFLGTAALLGIGSTFLLVGLSSEDKGKGLPRAIGLPVALALAAAGGAAAAWYVGVRLGGKPLYDWSTGIAVTCFMLIGVGILAMSQPDWRRVLLAMIGALKRRRG